jgi:hypothetical protein
MSARMPLLRAKLNFTAINTPDWKGFKIDVFQTSYVYGPTVERQHPFFQFVRRRIARASERKNAAGRAKVVHRGSRSPLVLDQFFPWSQQLKVFDGNAVNERASPNTDRAVANSNVINLGVDFENYLAAMTTAAVRFHGG